MADLIIGTLEQLSPCNVMTAYAHPGLLDIHPGNKKRPALKSQRRSFPPMFIKRVA